MSNNAPFPTMRTNSSRSSFFQRPAVLPENRLGSHHIKLEEPQLSQYPDNLRLNNVLTGIAAISNNGIENTPNFWTPETGLGLLPAVAVMGIGFLFAPNFAIGLMIGALQCLIGSLVALATNAIFPLERDKKNLYLTQVLNSPILATLVGPTLEELIFRGVLQPLLMAAISWLVPAAAALLFLGTGITIAAMLSIFVTSIIFGVMHLSNEHKGSYRQAVASFIAGFVLGLVAIQFGLLASIAAHIINNTILITVAAFFSGEQNENEPLTSISNHDEFEITDNLCLTAS